MLPLSEKTVVVTRPREQAAGIMAELQRLGAKVFLFPTIEIVPPESYAALDASIERLQEFDWLIFTSVNAFEHFLNRLAARNLETAELDFLRVAVVGEATAERVRLAQVHIDVLPTESTAEGLFAELQNYIGADYLAGLKFLMPRSEIGREILPEKLREARAEIETPIAYKNILPPKPDAARLKALLAGEAIDCITFTSPSTFKNFVQIFSDVNLNQLLNGARLAAIGSVTAEAIRAQGFEPQIIAPESTNASLAQAIADYFAQNK